MKDVLLVLAVGVWVVAGAPRLAGLAGAEWTAVDLAWVVVYGGFPVALVAARRASGRRALALTLLQSALALSLLPLGMPHFEGALLAVVGAQTLLVVSARWALLWIVVQGVALFVTILPSHALLGATKATGEYLAFSIFAMSVFALRDRERAQRRALQKMQAELLGTRALLRETVALAEQRRIQRELHDSFGHHLAAASAYLDAARRAPPVEPAQAQLDRARVALDRLTEESRAVLSGLRRGIDLEEALSALAGSIPGVRVELELGALHDLQADTAWVLFRAVQEAVTNAHKHGRARTVRVGAAWVEDDLRVRVENDGAAPSAVDEGLGLSTMRARLQDVGGRLEIDPGPPFALELVLDGARSRDTAAPGVGVPLDLDGERAVAS